jgi:predicted amidohydrolase YtcJ
MDLVLLGGHVLTMDDHNRRAQAVAVADGKIAAVGANAEIAPCIGPRTTVVHLAGRTAMPGFVDPHNHFSLTTFEPVSVDCRVPPHRSIRSILDAIAAAAQDLPHGRWIRGWGFRTWLVEEQRPISRWELDEAAPHHPVCLMDASCHACYANSAALALAGIDRHTPDPPHGWIRRDARGEPDGTLWEGAMDLVHDVSLRAYLEYYREAVPDLVAHNARRHLACGITSVGDALVTPDAAALYRLAEAQRRLPLVLHQMLGGARFFAPPLGVARGEIADGHVSDRLRGGTMKLFMDPVFPSYALIRRHACGHEERYGERYYTQEEADQLVLEAHRQGLQVAVHCLGNWAIEQALTAFERAQRRHPRADPRFRIEHWSLTTVEQIRRARDLGVTAVVQPAFLFTHGERYAERAAEVGGAVRPLPLASMRREGLRVAASSDSPCAPVEPLLGLYAAVTRRTRRDGTPIAPEEAVTLLEALRMYTIDAAYAMGREREVGSLERGKRADLVVLSHDPTAVDPARLRDIAVEQTYVEGRLLFRR